MKTGIQLSLSKSVKKTEKKICAKKLNLSSAESSVKGIDSCSAVSEIEENVPDYEPKVLALGEKITDERRMLRTEKKLREIIQNATSNEVSALTLRNLNENKKVKKDMKHLYKSMTNTMVSYINDGSIEKTQEISSATTVKMT